MLSKFDLWIYSDTSNCWDYVREWLIDKAGVPEEHVPKFGILPTNKLAMTKAYSVVKPMFIECAPEQNAVACQFVGRALVHVGVVDGPFVRHVSSKKGAIKDKISEFQKHKTVFFKYANA